MVELSILIPARNEIFLDRTIQDLLEHIEADTEIIAILDGYLPEPPLTQSDSRVTLIYNPESKGQRVATNQAAKIAKGKYIMKIDAHCAFEQGFDRKMLEAFKEVGDDVTMAPLMRNLHAFDWVCPKGHRRYQGPSGVCKECGEPTIKDVVWIAKTNPASTSYRFDKTMHFQYWGEYKKRQTGDLVESMSLQGSCFMCTKSKYFELNLCSEDFFSWGQQGTEVACKTWLSGGRVIINKRTWYAHMFRTQGGDFGFPYPQKHSEVEANRELSRELFKRDKWPLAKHKFQWLLDKFNPPDWGLTKGIIYYTDGDLDDKIALPVRERLIKIRKEKNLTIVTAALKKKLDFGDHNIYFPSLKRGPLTMFKQIVAALEHSTADIIFFCEHDDLYDASHFDFTPKDKNTYYYNVNVWQLRLEDGHCLYYHCRKLSQCVAYREVLLEHFKKKIKRVEESEKCKDGHFDRSIGFEPGGRHIRSGGVDDLPIEDFKSPICNIDIRHEGTYTGSKWKVEQFANRHYRNIAKDTWQEGDSIPDWGLGTDLVKSLT